MMFKDITLTSYVFLVYAVCSVVCSCSYSHMLPVCCRRKGRPGCLLNVLCTFNLYVYNRQATYDYSYIDKQTNTSKSDKNFFDKATIAIDFRSWWCHSDGDTARISQRKPQRDPNIF